MFATKISGAPKLPTTCTNSFINIVISLAILILCFSLVIFWATFYPFDKYKTINNVNTAVTRGRENMVFAKDKIFSVALSRQWKAHIWMIKAIYLISEI